MELKLYQHIRKHFVQADIDLFDKATQEKIEAYDKSIGLDEKILNAIKKYLKDYNRFLETQKIEKVKLRYYQLLALYFTEAYFQNSESSDFELFSKNTLAYWMATGSGKTIIMHLNVFQFIEHAKNFKDLELVMTTPGVNLIEQHEREVTPLIDYLNKIYRNKIRLTIDTTSALLNKPDDFFNFPDDKKMQRLILVDEAHIGLGKNQKDDEGEFLKLRRRLNIKHSFLFEYSATFHNLSANLENEYSKSIVYDYNYNLFYRDGYGKDFYFHKIELDRIADDYNDNLNLNLEVIEDKLSIFNKLHYRVKDLFNAEYFPDRPLIAFMGNTVNDKKEEGKGEDELSDISEIVKYLALLSEKERVKYKNVFKDNITGKLKLTRNVDDEILLSYGNGDYWGIVNVGNGLDFINNFPPDKVDKTTTTAVVIKDKEKYLFRNIDKPESPINVLIGSRKFAEGWNCFRVSVIGLINLGKTKGNKIIQIFGRGVRLKGLQNDGKRKDMAHLGDYFSLNHPDTEYNQLKKLETLCVFSLKRSWLETFTNAVNAELDEVRTFTINVKPNIVKLNDEKDVDFETYSADLKIFKLSRTSVEVKKVFLRPADRKLEYEYVLEGEKKSSFINDFQISLDYRTNKNSEGIDIKNDLKNINNSFQSFINTDSFDIAVIKQSDDSDLQVYTKTENCVSKITLADVLRFMTEIKYRTEIPDFDFEFIERLNSLIAEDFIRKLKNKINWHLNSSIYKYNEPLKQSKGDDKGDFIEKYTLIKSFKLSKTNGKQKSDAELRGEIKNFTESIQQIESSLVIDKIVNHIYEPLLRENKHVLNDDLKLTPDKLNDGEKKFVKDFSTYIKSNKAKFKGYDIYLMRNIESLKSIGIYLNDDSEVFYPDFIMWLISKEKIYINFIDPKGILGMTELTDAELLNKEKVKIADKANNQTLTSIEKELKRIHKKEFILNSFLLLRDSSPFGKFGKNSEWKKKNLIDKNIFRLDWHSTNENEFTADQTELVEGKTYLDWIIEKTI